MSRWQETGEKLFYLKCPELSTVLLSACFVFPNYTAVLLYLSLLLLLVVCLGGEIRGHFVCLCY